jgi:hypothetical protein
MNTQKNIAIGNFLVLLLAGLLVPVVGVPSTGNGVLAIRHGVHAQFERLVFDINRQSQYQVETVPENDNVLVRVDGIDPAQPDPQILLSPKTKCLLGVSPTSPGTFQISTLIPVTAESFTITGDPYRIVVDLYPQEVRGAVSKRQGVQQQVPPSEKHFEKSVPQSEVDIAEPQPKFLSQYTGQSDNDKAGFNLNNLYNLKLEALRLQTGKQSDSAAACWEQYLTMAKKLRVEIVGEEFVYASEEEMVKHKEGILSQLFAKYVFVSIPIGLLVMVTLIWVALRINSCMGMRNIMRRVFGQVEQEAESPESESSEEPGEPGKEEEETGESVEGAKEGDEESTEETEEPAQEEKPVGEEASEEIAEEDLEEFFREAEEPTAEEKKVQRILELAGEEKSIAEIAEEMGIGEDEVRLVLDLQGSEASAKGKEKEEVQEEEKEQEQEQEKEEDKEEKLKTEAGERKEIEKTTAEKEVPKSKL